MDIQKYVRWGERAWETNGRQVDWQLKEWSGGRSASNETATVEVAGKKVERGSVYAPRCGQRTSIRFAMYWSGADRRRLAEGERARTATGAFITDSVLLRVGRWCNGRGLEHQGRRGQRVCVVQKQQALEQASRAGAAGARAGAIVDVAAEVVVVEVRG